MSWLYGQTWLWYLIAFLIGLLLAWLVLVRPQQRRLMALHSRAAPAATPAAGPSAGAPATTGTTASAASAAAAGAAGAEPESRPVDPAGDAPTESIPVVDTGTEPPTDVFPAVDPALNTLDTANLVTADVATPPDGVPAVPAPDDTATPPEGLPVAAERPNADDLIPDDPIPEQAAATAETEDAPTSARPVRDNASSGQAAPDAPEARS